MAKQHHGIQVHPLHDTSGSDLNSLDISDLDTGGRGVVMRYKTVSNCDTKLFQIKIYKHAHFGVWTSPVAHTGKNLPATWETWVRSLGGKDPPEKGMATQSSILA